MNIPHEKIDQDSLKDTLDRYQFTLSVPDLNARKLVIGWLLLGLSALVIGGLFSVLIVLSRTPFFQEIIPWSDFFKSALVVHVDLTVLVWFLSFSGVFWCYASTSRFHRVAWIALLLCATGTVIITVSPFTGEGHPLMSNYVPVLQSRVFFVGLSIFGVGYTLLVLRSVFSLNLVDDHSGGETTLRFGLVVALVASFFAISALILSYIYMGNVFVGQAYYDRLFWGSGHIIQFSHTQLVLVSWLWLASISGATLRVSPRVVFFLFILGLSPLLLVPLIYLQFDVSSGGHVFWFTQLMKYGGALGAVPIALATTVALFDRWHPAPEFSIERSALVFSVLLFGAGGIIGFMIHASNVTVPAHYHGSIVGITVAFMGITYHLLPHLGFRKVTQRIAKWQPLIYGGGQLTHITGLAWSGGYGVQRKTSGSAQNLDQIEQIAGMALMGLGGLISIIGGMIFLVVVFLAIKPVQKRAIRI